MNVYAKIGAVATFAALAATANAQSVVNVDFEGATAGDTTYNGDDAALSTVGGTNWNSVDVATGPAISGPLSDEFGVATPFDVEIGSTPFPDTDPASTNVLEDSGIGSSFTVRGLVPGTPYTVVGYVMTNGGFDVVDASGSVGFQGFGFNFDMQSYDLPGVQGGGPTNEDGDYMRFDNLMPYDYGGGLHALDFNLDGSITGLQIYGQIPTPATPALAALGALATLRRRR